MEDKPLTEKMKQAKQMLNEMEIRQIKRQSATFVGEDLDLLIMLLRRVVYLVLLCSVSALQAQNRGTIGHPGPTLPMVDGDSMGLAIPFGEIVHGTGTKLPGSSDSLIWNAGLSLDASLFLTGLPDLSESAGDSNLIINSSGTVFKSVLGVNFFTSNGTATGNRSHDFNNFNLDILDIGNFTITANTNWSFNTTASDIKINAITGLGMNIATTGATNSLFLSSGNDIDLSATDDLIFDAPDIILEDPLTLSTWDSILVRHPTTGEIQARLASTIAGADSMGIVRPSGYLLMGQGNSLPDTSKYIYFDGTKLGLGHTAPLGDVHVIGLAPTTQSSLIIQSDNANTVMTSTFAAISLRNNDATSNNYVRINFQDASSTAASAIAGQITNHTNDYGTLEFWTRSSGGFSQKMVITENGRVGIGNTPATSAILDVASTTGAVLLPRMTTAQRDALTAVAGMIIYNTTTGVINGYESGAWVDL